MNILHLASLLLLWLPHLAAESLTIEAEDLEGFVTPATSVELGTIELLLYTGTTIDEYTSVLIDEAANLVDKLNSSKPTVFYIFGWTESPESTSVKEIVEAYLKRGDHNVVLINWEYFAAKSYLVAAVNADNVGTSIATSFNDMVAAGLNSSTIHIVSHSLGSQVAGFIGRRTNFTIPRITGLDPAGPGFYIIVENLSSGDADFVDVIHTDAAGYGTASKKADANFYPNGGTRVQTGCTRRATLFSDEDFCSHHRSWYYYAESLLNGSAFMGQACNSYAEFKLGRCSGETAVMGYDVDTTASGTYYLQTNSEAPFGRGAAGETYTA